MLTQVCSIFIERFCNVSRINLHPFNSVITLNWENEFGLCAMSVCHFKVHVEQSGHVCHRDNSVIENMEKTYGAHMNR